MLTAFQFCKYYRINYGTKRSFVLFSVVFLMLCFTLGISAQDTIRDECLPVILLIPSDIDVDNVDVVEWTDQDNNVLKKLNADSIEINDFEPSVAPLDTMTYTFKYVDQKNDNLIINGDFETPLTEAEATILSDYDYRIGYSEKGSGTKGSFGIGNSPAILKPEWYFDMPDHTKGDGTGLMFYADGSPKGNRVYKTTVTVEAGKEYALIGWFSNVHISLLNPQEMDFYINNFKVGSLKGEASHDWFQYYGFWVSGVSGDVELKYVNTNTVLLGNDFAIDDLVLAPVQTRTVTVIPPNFPPVAVTQNITVQLDMNAHVSITASQVDGGSYKTCGTIDSMTIDLTDFNCDNIGDNEVILTVWSDSVSASSSAIVTVADDMSYCALNIPKGFSPNADNINDEFEIEGINVYKHVSLTIFNRWGNIVFEENDYQKKNNLWDGNSNSGSTSGKELPVGTYYYVLEIKDKNFIRKGSIYLSR